MAVLANFHKIFHFSVVTLMFLNVVAANVESEHTFVRESPRNNDCNEALCAPGVSFCLLSSYCRCDNPRTNLSCQRKCMDCLDYLAQDCCLCIDMCNRTTVPGKPNAESLKKSNFEFIADSENALFELLTEAPDPMERWTTEVFVWDGKTVANYSSANNKSTTTAEHGVGGESACTVTFMSQCMTFNKCKTSCSSMGATSYRWFYDGCCECVGEHCPPFGLEVAKCQQCPLHTIEDVVEEEQKDHQEPDDENHANVEDQSNEPNMEE